MQSGALRKATRRPQLEKLHRGENVVVDARERFLQRRNREPAQTASPLPVPDSGLQALVKKAAPRPPQSITPLTSRVETYDKLAFILIRDGVDETDGARCVVFTVIPAPADESDDERYVMPYLRRGWEVLVQCHERPGLPGAVDMHADPQTVIRNALDRLDLDDRAIVEERLGNDLRFVSDPLSR